MEHGDRGGARSARRDGRAIEVTSHGRGGSRWVMNQEKPTTNHGRGVQEFLARHADKVTGVISGFDRLRMQGSVRALYAPELMQEYLWRAKVLLKDFKAHVTALTERVYASAEAVARTAGLSVRYLRSAATSKEDLVAARLREHPVNEGLVAVLSAVEPCRTWFVRGNRSSKRLELQLQPGKCLHHYFYLVHEHFGLMHVRVQSWFPFQVHLVLNGREWLCRQLDAEGIAYRREDNCLPWIADIARAQALLDAQARVAWPKLLPPLVERFHPEHQRIHEILPVDYYWTVAQSEYATDVMFHDRKSLEAIYPQLVHHAITSFGATDVLRFLGRRHAGESAVQSSRLTRVEGTRIKHWVDANSLKLYDKGSVLRDEGTINVPESFKVFRTSERDPHGPKSWRTLRRSVVDMPRRAEVSRAATDRHLGALAAVHHGEALGGSAAGVCRPVVRKGRRYRALNLFHPEDMALLSTVNRGEFALHGLRNRDVRALLYSHPPAALTSRQLADRVTRKLSLLRAHGLIARVPKTQRYIVTKKGRTIITALLAAAHADTEQLTKLAA